MKDTEKVKGTAWELLAWSLRFLRSGSWVRQQDPRAQNTTRVAQDWVRDHLSKVGIVRSVGLTTWEVSAWADTTAKLLPLLLPDVHDGYKKANVIPVLTKGKRRRLGSYKLCPSLQKDYGVNPGFAVSSYTKDKTIGNNLHRFTKGNLELANLLTFCNGTALWTRAGQWAVFTLTLGRFLPCWDMQTIKMGGTSAELLFKRPWAAVQSAAGYRQLCRKCLNGWDEDEQVYTLYTCNPNGLGWGDHLKVI